VEEDERLTFPNDRERKRREVEDGKERKKEKWAD
jgi:hypothetical protein